MNFRKQLALGVVAGVALGTGFAVQAGGIQPRGGEFPLTRGLPGDQVNPAMVLRASAGVLVWQDAAIDGDGLGIAVAKVSTGGENPAATALRLNQSIAGDQEEPALALLSDGRAFVAWQSGRQGFQNIAGRFVGTDGAPAGDELIISTGNGESKLQPVVASLPGGGAVVAWASYRQDGSSGFDVYARILTADGRPLGDEFRVNSTTGMGRRSPTIGLRGDGGFTVVWVAERQLGIRDNVDPAGRPVAGGGALRFEAAVMARAFAGDGTAVGPELKVSSDGSVAANPVVAELGQGELVVAWTRRSRTSPAARFDVAVRRINGFGVPVGDESLLNQTEVGDQLRPRLAATPYGVFAVWTSMAQDGSFEGVYGRWLDSQGIPQGDEIPVNSQVGGRQILPTVASDPDGGLTVAWASNLPRTGYEIFAQRFAPLKLRARSLAGSTLKMDWATLPGSTYQLQMSRDGVQWSNVGGTRPASSDSDSVELPPSGRMVLYRVVRVR